MAIINSAANRDLLDDRFTQYMEKKGEDESAREFAKLLGGPFERPQDPASIAPDGTGAEGQDRRAGPVDLSNLDFLDTPRIDVSRPKGAEGGDGEVDGYRAEANDFRSRAEDQRRQAGEVEGNNPEMAQTFRERAIAFDRAADSADERADIALERRRISEEGRRINDSGINENTVVVGYPEGRRENLETQAGWLDERELEVYANALDVALADVAEFGGDIEVSASREANDAEVDAFLDRAELNGATEADFELIEGYTQAFPIQFVFVDNLIDDFGIESAAGGEITVEGTTTILVDSSFRDVDFTRVSEFDDPEVSERGTAAVEFAYDSVLEIFDLPGTLTGNVEGAQVASDLPPLAEGGDAAIVATPAMSTTAAVPTVESTDEDDEANADANAAVSGAGNFDADE